MLPLLLLPLLLLLHRPYPRVHRLALRLHLLRPLHNRCLWTLLRIPYSRARCLQLLLHPHHPCISCLYLGL